MEGILIEIDGTKRKVQFESFAEARAIICGDEDCMAEIVRLEDGSLFLIDEIGKIKELPVNLIATEIAQECDAIYPHDFIVGNVLLIENERDFEELPY
jgi:hypothetical protein